MGNVQQYITDANRSLEFSQHEFRHETRPEMCLVKAYPQRTRQEIVGFGAALTEASASVFAQMPPDAQDQFLQMTFGAQGSAYNLCRLHLQSCDFSLGSYAYMKKKRDKELKTFDMSRDRELTIPFIKCCQEAARAAGRDMDFVAAPWSPPAFMKNTHLMALGGKLRKKYAPMWAAVIAHATSEYAREGISISRVSVQNEPMARQTWESCLYSAEEEAVFAVEHLRPALDAAGLQHVQIMVWDHNKDNLLERVDETLAYPGADEAVGAVAFHWYSGDHFEELAEAVRTHPGKDFLFTEGCVEYSRFAESNQEQKAEHYAHDMIGNFNAGACGFVDWNVLLNEEGGPNHVGNFCEAPLMYDRESQQLIVNRSHHYIQHFSRFVQRGARVFLTSSFSDSLQCVGFVNPGGQRVMVVLNKNFWQQPFTLCEGNNVCDIQLPPHSIATFVWE